MNNIQVYIGYAAGILGFIPYIFFILSIRKGTTKLNLAGWILYTVAMIMIVASSVALGAWQTIWLAIAYVFGQLAVIITALKKGYFAWSKFDYACLSLSFIGLLLWIHTSNPLYALVLNVIVDGLGTLAIAKKTWAHPDTEETKSWVMSLSIAILNCFAIASFDLSNALYPIYLVFANLLIVILSLRKTKLNKLYRYTTNGEGVWSAGKRLLPLELVEEVNTNRAWLVKTNLPEGEYCFFMKEKGKEQYENTLMKVHEKYLSNIMCEEVNLATLGTVVYEDEWQVVTLA